MSCQKEKPTNCVCCGRKVDNGVEYSFYVCKYVADHRGKMEKNPTSEIYCNECHGGGDHEGYYSGYTLSWECEEQEGKKAEVCCKCHDDECELFLKYNDVKDNDDISDISLYCKICVGCCNG